MVTQSGPHERDRSRFQTIVELCLLKVLSGRSKRICFVVSLWAYMHRLEQRLDLIEQDALAKLNRAFTLAKDDKSLQFPAAVSGWIWSKTPIDDVLLAALSTSNGPQLTDLASIIANRAPKWMHYGRDGDMGNEVCTMLETVRRQPQQLAMAA